MSRLATDRSMNDNNHTFKQNVASCRFRCKQIPDTPHKEVQAAWEERYPTIAAEDKNHKLCELQIDNGLCSACTCCNYSGSRLLACTNGG